MMKMVVAMWNKSDGYYSKFKYVELMRFNPDTNKMARSQSGNEIILTEWKDVEAYAKRYRQTGIYTSIFRYPTDHIDNTVQLGNLYFDLDSDRRIESALQDGRKIVEYLGEFIPASGIRIYFTGKKGFHIECEALAIGVTPAANLASIYRYIANELKNLLDLSTIDFAVYEPRRMWRLPYSRHQSTGYYKIELTREELNSLGIGAIQKLAETPRVLEVPDQKFDYKANQWFREFEYAIEQSKIAKKFTSQDIIARFNQYGSGHVVDYEKEFDPVRLFEGCPAILKLWQKAEQEHNLEHMERLFLCSLLTYTDEAIEYLHSILSNCDDYLYERSQAHIDDWVRRREYGTGGRPFSCRKAREVGIDCDGCSKLEPKPKYEEIAGKLYLTDSVSEPSPIRMAYRKKV